MKCYGTSAAGKREECKTCAYIQYCLDAREKMAYTLEYDDTRKPILEEHEFWCYDDPLPDAQALAAQEQRDAHNIEMVRISSEMRVLLRQLLKACNANPFYFFILAGRVGGMTQSQIGRSCGMTKQAVSKHCRRLAAESADLRRFLRMNFAPDGELLVLFRKLKLDIRNNDGRRTQHLIRTPQKMPDSETAEFQP